MDLEEALKVNPKYYISYIPKKSGKRRILEKPDFNTKQAQKYILYNVIYKTQASKFCHGFVKSKGVVTNANAHKGAKIIIKLDILEFFRFTKVKRIRKSLIQSQVICGLTNQDMNKIVNICTINGHLPTGACTSPAISNLVLKEFDKNVATKANNMGIVYSRYADDMTFSSKDRITKKHIKEIIRFVANELKIYGPYKLNHDKIKIFTSKDRMTVTGVNINNNILSIPKKYRNNLRAQIHQISSKEDIEKVVGKLAWIKSVNAESATKLENQLETKLKSLEIGV